MFKQGGTILLSRRIAALFTVLLTGITLLMPGVALAQSNALGVTPKLSYTIKPGEQKSDTLYVNNLNKNQALNLRIEVQDFGAVDETGAPKLLRGQNQPTAWSLKPFLTIPDTFRVEAGKSALIPFTIKVPANVGAGTYYSAVEYTAVTEGTSEQVNVAASSATLLFVNVPGKVTELMSLEQFGIFDNGKFKASLLKSPTTFAYRLKNSGNVAESPAGTIIIKNIFGKVVAQIDNANPKNELALIGQTRRFEVCYPKSTNPSDLVKNDNCQPVKLSPGRYTAQLAVLYGQNGQPTRQISAITSFWYMPFWALAIALAIIVLIVMGIMYLRRRRHSRRRR